MEELKGKYALLEQLTPFRKNICRQYTDPIDISCCQALKRCSSVCFQQYFKVQRKKSANFRKKTSNLH